ncbi:MAG TPA: MBL fold metallo-hydrolase [Candidatus Hypogeohydataceae bacterium YC41]
MSDSELVSASTTTEKPPEEVIILGSGSGIPSLRRGSAGIVIKMAGEIILLDTGPGILHKLLTLGITYADIDRVFYTHYHPDHCAELIPMLFAMKHGELRREKSLWLFGPPGLKKLYQGLNSLFNENLSPRTYDLRILELWDAEVNFGSWRIIVRPVVHFGPSLGYRVIFPSGKAIAYPGDTDYCEAVVELARGVEALILECSFPEEMKLHGHLVPSLCGKIAQEAAPKKLILTHFYPQWDGHDMLAELGKYYSGESIPAEDMTKILL